MNKGLTKDKCHAQLRGSDTLGGAMGWRPETLGRHRLSHRIHGAGIYANIGGILMVNVTIYSIHGSYGYGQRLTVESLKPCCDDL